MGDHKVAAADNWTARVKYLFVDLQNATFNPPVVPAHPPPQILLSVPAEDSIGTLKVVPHSISLRYARR